MSFKNRTVLIGNLGRDAEVRRLESGKIVAQVSIATTENYKNAAGEKVTDTQWHNLVVWGKLAEVAEKYWKKGKKIGVAGKLTHRKYTDKEGVEKYTSEIVVHEFEFLDGKQEGTVQAVAPVTAAAETTPIDDSLPF